MAGGRPSLRSALMSVLGVRPRPVDETRPTASIRARRRSRPLMSGHISIVEPADLISGHSPIMEITGAGA
jgi:hypothetical protein